LKWISLKTYRTGWSLEGCKEKLEKMITEEKNKRWERHVLQWKSTWVVIEAHNHGEY